MFDPSTSLREQYFAVLDGNLNIGAKNAPLFDLVIGNQPFPYVRFDQIFVSEHFPQCRNTLSVLASVILTIFTGFESSYHKGGKRYPDILSEQILNILRTTPLDLSPDYSSNSPVLESLAYLEPDEEAERVVQKTIQIQHIISTL